MSLATSLDGRSPEGAHRIARVVARAPHPLPPAPAGALDDLLHALVAEPEGQGDLPQQSARQMQPPDDRVVVGTGEQRLALGRRESFALGFGLLKQRLVESAIGRPP